MSPSALVRSWPALAAWGAGLVELGLGAGAIVKGADAVDRGIGILLATVGAATTMVRGGVPVLSARIAVRISRNASSAVGNDEPRSNESAVASV